jgi:hypothetical protein
MSDEMPDPEKIKEILNVVSEKVPDLLKQLSGVLYSPDQAKNFGVAVAIFYKELKAAGMTDEQAFELTKQYMSTLNIGGMFSNFAGGGSNGTVKIVGKEIVGDDK